MLRNCALPIIISAVAEAGMTRMGGYVEDSFKNNTKRIRDWSAQRVYSQKDHMNSSEEPSIFQGTSSGAYILLKY